MNIHVQIVQLEKKNYLAYDVDSTVQSRLERNVVDVADAVALFDRKEEKAGQIPSGTDFGDADCHSSYI